MKGLLYTDIFTVYLIDYTQSLRDHDLNFDKLLAAAKSFIILMLRS